MTKVEEAMQEIADALAVFEPEKEGLDDYLLLDIHDDTRVQVTQLDQVYTDRIVLLHAAHTALTNLMTNGHPDMDKKLVNESVFADLQENKKTIDAALAKFQEQANASSLGLTAGAVEPK